MSSQESASKLAKEAFVTGHTGTTAWEISQVVLLLPLLAVAATLFPATQPEGRGRYALWIAYVRDFCALLVPEVLVMTSESAASAMFWVACALASSAVTLTAASPQQRGVSSSVLSQHQRRFVSHFRGAVMLCTCIGILAVDFHAFPRRFAKAEIFGTGLMDTGVGAFVFANGLVFKRACGTTAPGIAHTFRISAPLIALGVVRLASTKAVQYQEHASEYGAHWNFFFTLAAVTLISTAVPLQPSQLLPVGVSLLALHQAALSAGGLIEVVHSEQRGPGLLSLNKEGLLSLPGYLALHLLSAAFGRHLLACLKQALLETQQHEPQSHEPSALGKSARQHEETGQKQSASGRTTSLGPLYSWLVWVAALDGGLWVGWWLVSRHVQRVSRRACNAAYVLWILAGNVQLLLPFMLLDVLTPQHSLPLLSAVSSNMLPVFLLANVLTGLVNLRVDTLAVGDWMARCVVALYMALLCAVAAVLHAKGVRLKFWK